MKQVSLCLRFSFYTLYINNSTTAIERTPIKDLQVAAPNPFSGTTRFSRPEYVSESSTLNIYSLSGKLLGSFSFAEGDQLIWDGTDLNRNPLPDGLFVYTIHDNENQARYSGKIVLKR